MKEIERKLVAERRAYYTTGRVSRLNSLCVVQHKREREGRWLLAISGARVYVYIYIYTSARARSVSIFAESRMLPEEIFDTRGEGEGKGFGIHGRTICAGRIYIYIYI